MAFTTPGTAVAGDVLTASFWNSNVRDNINDLRTTDANVQQVTKTDTFSTSSTTFGDITGQGGTGTFQVSITPSSATSKILVIGFLSLGGDTNNTPISARVLRGATAIFVGDAAGARVLGMFQHALSQSYNTPATIAFLDSPATTSSTTYKWQVRCDVAGTLRMNRSFLDEDAATRMRAASSLIVMEVVQ